MLILKSLPYLSNTLEIFDSAGSTPQISVVAVVVVVIADVVEACHLGPIEMGFPGLVVRAESGGDGSPKS